MRRANDRNLRFPLTTNEVTPTSHLQSHLGAIDEWSLMGDVTLKAFVIQRIIERYQTIAQTICLDS